MAADVVVVDKLLDDASGDELLNFPPPPLQLLRSGSDIWNPNFFTSSINDAVGDESFLILMMLFRGLLLHNFLFSSNKLYSSNNVVSVDVLSVGLKL